MEWIFIHKIAFFATTSEGFISSDIWFPTKQHGQSFCFIECVVVSWQNEVNRCCFKIEEQTKSSLHVIRSELIRKGSKFADKFKEYFLQKVNTRYCKSIKTSSVEQSLIYTSVILIPTSFIPVWILVLALP